MLKKVLLSFALLRLCKGNPEADNSKNEISSLNSTKVIQVLGDSIVIIQKKNYTDLNDFDDPDDFVDYLHNHVLRIKSSNNDNKFYDFELNDLIPDNNSEGRARRQELKKILLPILVALKLKSTILIPIFLAFVALIAIKGFWAGMTALFVSKAVALKVFYNTANNRDRHRDDFDDHDDYEDYDQRYHDHYDDHRYYRRPHNAKGRPIVIYLNDKSGPYNRHHEEVYEEESNQNVWDSWRRNYLNWNKQKWEPSPSLSEN